MNFRMAIFDEGGKCVRAGVWSASNLHTALARAVSGYPMEKARGPSHVGAARNWYWLGVGKSARIEVTRL